MAACNAAGLSVFNFIEQRMALLSTELSGIVLPDDSFGTQPGENGKTLLMSKSFKILRKRAN